MKIKYISITLISFLLLFLNCHKETPTSNVFTEIFAIYISNSSDYQTIPELKEIQLSEEPLLTDNTIEQYNWSSHQISFSSAVHEALNTRGNLLHKIFVVFAYGQRIYCGKFMDDADSGTFQNPVIRLYPRHPDGRNTTPEKFIIERAYPEYFGSENDPDIRNNQKVYEALIKAGILRNN